MGQVTITTPLLETICHLCAGLVTVQQCIEFQISMFTYYEDMKGDECRNWGGFGVTGHSRSSATQPFDRAYKTSYSTLIDMHLSCTVFELLNRLFSKN